MTILPLWLTKMFWSSQSSSQPPKSPSSKTKPSSVKKRLPKTSKVKDIPIATPVAL